MIISPQRTSPFNLPLVSGGGFVGLLDEYGGAAAAYSVRRLSSAYSGALMEVRRSSDNTTQDIGYDANGDLDTTALLAFVGAGNGFVRTWYDQSGNGNNAQQTTTSNQPQIVNSGSILLANSKPNVRFTTNTQQLQSSSADEFIGVTTNSTFTVGSLTTLNVGNQYLSGVIINTNRGFMVGSEVSTDRMRYHCNPSGFTVISGGTLISDSQQLLCGLYNTNSGEAFINGASIGTSATTVAAGTPNYYFIGYGWSPSGTSRNAQEIIIYPTHESANRIGIETNINSYFSIY